MANLSIAPDQGNFLQSLGVTDLPQATPPSTSNSGASYVQPYSDSRVQEILAKVNIPSQYDTAIDAAAKQYNLDPKLLKAHLIAESNLDPNARNGSAVGLGQLEPATASSIGIDPTNPQQSILGVAKLISRYGGQTEEGFIKYYAGPNPKQVGANSKQYAQNMLAVKKALGVSTPSQDPQQSFLDSLGVNNPQDEAKQEKRIRLAALQKQTEQQQQQALKEGTVGGALKSFGQDVWDSLKTVPSTDLQHLKNVVAGIKADLTTPGQHSTQTITLDPTFYQSAKEIGISQVDLMNAGVYPQLGKNNLTIYKKGSQGIQDTIDKAVKAVGGDAQQTRDAIEAGMQGDFSKGDLLAAILHKSMMAQAAFLLTHPEWQATRMYETVKNYQKAKFILEDHFVPPGQTWKEASAWAQAQVQYAQTANMSPTEQIKSLWKAIQNEPDKTVKGMLFGIAMDPELFAVGGAGAASKLFRAGSIAAKVAKVAAPIAAGAGINEAITSVQGQADKGYSTIAEQLGAGATGALIGAGMEGAGKIFKYAGFGSASYDGKGKVKPAQTVQEAVKSNPPGEPLPITTPVTEAHNIPLTGGVGLHAIHMDENISDTFSLKNKTGETVDVPGKEIVARVHESVEYPLMHLTGPMSFDSIRNLVDRIKGHGRLRPQILAKLKNGESLSYPEAHQIATWAENKYVLDNYNVDPKDYQDAWKPYIEKAEAEGKAHNENVPQDLDTKPYDDMGNTEELLGDKGTKPPVDQAKGEQKGESTNEKRAKIKRGVAATGSAALAGGYVYSQRDKEAAAKHLGEAIFVSPFLAKGGQEGLMRAEEMFRAGEDPRVIHAETGLWKAPGGDWTYNFSTADIFHPDDITSFVENTHKDLHYLGEIMDSPELLKAYPELKNTQVILDDKIPSNFKGLVDRHGRIHINPEIPQGEIKSVLVHEVQHLIQKKEGWPVGGNAKEEAARYADLVRQEIEGSDDPELKQYLSKYLIDRDSIVLRGHENYWDLAGEGQARAAQDIRNYEQSTLDKLYPGDIDTYAKGPIREWLVRYKESEAGAEIPEPQLIEQAKQGDRRSLDLLFKTNYPQLLKSIRGMAAGKGYVFGADPEDIAQKTMIKAMQNLDSFEGRSSFSTWLYKIAKNERLNAIKAEIDVQSRPHLLSTEDLKRVQEDEAPGEDENILGILQEEGKVSEADTVSSQIATPEKEALNNDIRNELEKQLKRLPPHFQKVMLMSFEKEMSDADIAKELNTTLQNVKNWKFQARKLLFQRIDPSFKDYLSKQRGSIDPKLFKQLARMGLILGGAYTGAMYFSHKGDNEKLGAWYGALAVSTILTLHPRNIRSNVKNLWSKPPVNDVRDLLNNYDGIIRARTRATAQMVQAVKDLVPNKKDREVLTHARQGTYQGELTDNQKKALDIIKAFYDQTGLEAYGSGIVKELLSHYINQEWVHDSKFKELSETLYNKVSPKDRHGLRRYFQNYQEGIDKGLTPVTLDAAALMDMYGESMTKAIASKELLDSLKSTLIQSTVDAKGTVGKSPMVMATKRTVKDKATGKVKVITPPINYVQVDHPALLNYRVHPSIAPSLRFVFQAKTLNGLLTAVEGLNTAMKRAEVSFSLFHLNNLTTAFVAANPWFRTDSNLVKIAMDIPKILAGKDRGHYQYLHGTVNDALDFGLRSGLNIERRGRVGSEDIQNDSFYPALQRLSTFLDNSFPGGGKLGNLAIHFNKGMDKLLWENGQTGFKLITHMNAFEQLNRSWAAQLEKDPSTQVPDKLDLGRRAADFSNMAFGGLDWRRIADDATTKWGRALGHTLLNPFSRRILQILFFAPDWDVSTFRMYMKAFSPEGSVIKGMFGAKTTADLARQYVWRSALLYFTMFNAINFITVGHPIWQNQDPLSIDLGNGEKTPANKHAMEVPHFVMDAVKEKGLPSGYIRNKLGGVTSAFIGWISGTDYTALDGHPIPIKGSKFMYVLKKFVPFIGENWTAHSLVEDLLQVAGQPIYGHKAPQTEEQIEALHQERSERSKRAAEKRKQERMNRLFGG